VSCARVHPARCRRQRRSDDYLRTDELQDRGELFVGPGVEVYEGMIIERTARSEDMDINATKERKVTNVRSSTSESWSADPPRLLSLEQALEFIATTSASRPHGQRQAPKGCAGPGGTR